MSLPKTLFLATLLLLAAPLHGAEDLSKEVSDAPQPQTVPASPAPEPHTALLAGLGGLVLLLVAMRRK